MLNMVQLKSTTTVIEKRWMVGRGEKAYDCKKTAQGCFWKNGTSIIQIVVVVTQIYISIKIY